MLHVYTRCIDQWKNSQHALLRHPIIQAFANFRKRFGPVVVRINECDLYSKAHVSVDIRSQFSLDVILDSPTISNLDPFNSSS